MDNTCFGYAQKITPDKVIEMCTPLHCSNCETCRFYKRPHVLQHEKALAEIRNKKLESGALKTKYSLHVNGNKEGIFSSIKEIDDWLLKSRYSTDTEKGELDIEGIFALNSIKIRKERL